MVQGLGMLHLLRHKLLHQVSCVCVTEHVYLLMYTVSDIQLQKYIRNGRFSTNANWTYIFESKV